VDHPKNPCDSSEAKQGEERKPVPQRQEKVDAKTVKSQQHYIVRKRLVFQVILLDDQKKQTQLS
jgi:hypothetical protein